MLRRILLLLGETRSSVSARQYAFRLVGDMSAGLTGLAGIDVSYMEAPISGVTHPMAYKRRLEEGLRGEADAIRQRLHEAFELECKDHGLPFEWLSFEGDPISTLYMAMETRDLIVTGHDTAYRGNVHEQLAETLASILLITPRPIVVCPDELSSAKGLLVAYDGSAPAMRAIQMFALLGIGKNQRVYVVSVNSDQELAARRASGAAAYLRCHGYEAVEYPIVSTVDPAEVLRIEIADHEVGTLVMGAHGHRGLREFLFGSTTKFLIENPPCPLFVYH
jgi:nucleotide-binding universal stress UspA family protein